MRKHKFVIYSITLSVSALCTSAQTVHVNAFTQYSTETAQPYAAALTNDNDDGTTIQVTNDEITYDDEGHFQPEYDLPSHIFNNEKVKKIILPANVARILRDEVYETDLAYVQNYQSLTPNCPNLSEIEVSAENPYFKTIDGVLYSKDGTILYYCPPGKRGELIIPEGVERISLMAFQECAKLTSITFPSTLQYISEGAFGNTEKLSSIVVSSENENFVVKDNVLFGNDMETLYLYPGGKTDAYYTVPDGVITIHSSAFLGNTYLKKLTTANTLTIIENEAFKNCTSLKTVVIKKGMLDIGGGAFLNCSSLKKINFPYGIRAIYFDALTGCDNLKAMSFPRSITELVGMPALSAGSVVKFYSPYIGHITLADGVKASDVTVYVYKGSTVEQRMLEEGVRIKYYANEYSETKSVSSVPKGTVSGNGKPDTSWYDKSKSTYSIQTPDELAGLAKLVNSGYTFHGKKVILAKNLNMDCYSNWMPIGADNGETTYQFKGTFDGGNHTIYNLRINRIDTNEVGLFGVLNGTVENLTISDADVIGNSDVGILSGMGSAAVTNCHISGRVNGYQDIGGIIGRSSGTITSCTLNVTLYGIHNIGGISGSGSSSVTKCTVDGLISGLYQLGGFLGGAYGGTVTGCENKADVSGHLDAGGILGMMDGVELINCTNNGDVRGYDNAGGIIGNSFDGDAADCLNTGNVTGNNNIGGIAGRLSVGTLHRCSNTGDVSGISVVGGILGTLDKIYPETDRVFECTNQGTVTGSRYVDDNIGRTLHYLVQ